MTEPRPAGPVAVYLWVSSQRQQHQQTDALRDQAAAGRIGTVLALSADRLSRNFAYQILLQEELTRHGVDLVLVQEPDQSTPQQVLLRQILSVISEYERTQIAERSRRGRIHRARQGSLNMLTKPAYGYRLIRKTETRGARLEIDAAEADTVRLIFALYVRDRLTMVRVADRLHAMGKRPRHAARWRSSTVAGILRNTAYVGRAAYLKTMNAGRQVRHNRVGRRKGGAVRSLLARTARPRDEWIELAVPAIVDADLFARAQEQRASNRRFSGRRTMEPTLLQGLCVCAHCGYRMLRNSTRTSGGRVHHYYRCLGRDGWRHPDGPVCDNPQVRAGDLDQAVWDEVFALLESPERIRAELRRRIDTARDTAPARRRVADLQGERSRCQAQSRRLLDAYQESLVSLDELRVRNEPLQTRLRGIEAELKSLQSAELERASGLTLALHVSQFLERMREGEQTMVVADRQRLLCLLVREVQVGARTASPFATPSRWTGGPRRAPVSPRTVRHPPGSANGNL